MRLLHTTELRFEEFFDSKVPEYAILSHRWGNDEVSYQEFQALTTPPEDMMHAGMALVLKSKLEAKRNGAGYQKIVDACSMAVQGRVGNNPVAPRYDIGSLKWIWIDTCCIDKSSSAELSEAINSMFKWYQKARVCYAFLADVKSGADFAASNWFRRGWTLQELLAPRTVLFLSHHWTPIGWKRSLASSLSQVTAIEEDVLTGRRTIPSVCVATRMLWAANRETTRVEDIAYSLLGIFDVNMPLLYGEGIKAFTRLQEAIIGQSDDITILAHKHQFTTPLARFPSDFLLPFDVDIKHHNNRFSKQFGEMHHSIINKGVRIANAAFANKDKSLLALPCQNNATKLPMLLPVRCLWANTYQVDHEFHVYVYDRQSSPLLTGEIQSAEKALEIYYRGLQDPNVTKRGSISSPYILEDIVLLKH